MKRIINVVTATCEKDNFGPMLKNLKTGVPIVKKCWPDMGFHILTARSGPMFRVLYVEQFPSMAAHEKWQESWGEYPEAMQIIEKHVGLIKTESVEIFQLEGSTADE
ncbi:MAG: hypothetical protein HN368_15615 [Spirochaetales bacterium]|jgi:hypothetical protein|nr:hypothetical protein [Spirochaetales bacterium]